MDCETDTRKFKALVSAALVKLTTLWKPLLADSDCRLTRTMLSGLIDHGKKPLLFWNANGGFNLVSNDLGSAGFRPAFRPA